MSFTQLAEVRTFFTDEGAGDPPVLFVHGWTCDSLDWSWQLPVFTARHRVLAADIRGHGRSSRPAKGWDPRTMAGDLAELLDSLGAGPVVAVGHSLGGMIDPPVRRHRRVGEEHRPALLQSDLVWEGVGHWLHQVRPDEFNALVLSWIAGLPAR